MTIRKCTSCGSPMFVPPAALGKAVKCKKCGAIIHIEAPVETAQPAEEEPMPPSEQHPGAAASEEEDTRPETVAEPQSGSEPSGSQGALTAGAVVPARESVASPVSVPRPSPLAEVSAWLENAAKFADVARNAENPLVREEAVRKVEDQSVLSEIALHDTSHWVREAAVKRLTEQGTLVKIAQTDPDHWVREVAVKKVEDPAILAEIAKTDGDHWVCETALRKLGKV